MIFMNFRKSSEERKLWTQISLRGRRLKGKGKGVLGARETRRAREEGGRKTPATKPLFFSLLTSSRRMLKS